MKYVLLPLVSLILLSFVIVELYDFDKMLINLDNYSNEIASDKVYLHTDKTIYALEDTIWIKTYALDGVTHRTSDKSRIVYIELITPDKQVLYKDRVYIGDMGAASDITIQRSWLAGRYLLRAYTKYMLNEDQDYFFSKEIKIVDINAEYDRIIAEPSAESIGRKIDESQELDIGFFPEGGHLISGIDSKVAIKVKNKNLSTSGMQGTIEDQDGNQVAAFKIYDFGLGSANFTPVYGNRYFAKMEGDKLVHPLPEILESGYQMTVINKSGFINVITRTNKEEGLQGGHVLIHIRGAVYYNSKILDADSKETVLKFDISQMPSGIAHITFFDESGRPQCERLTFVDNSIVKMDVSTDKSSYSKRDKVKMSLSPLAPDSLSDIRIDCSVAIIHDDSRSVGSSTNIKSWLLLNSDLRGKIDNPGYFFEKEGDHKRAYLLDLVMLTHGWRRFNWDQMKELNPFQNYTIEGELGLYVKGYTSKLINKKSNVQSNMTLTLTGDAIVEADQVTDDEGRFSFGPYIVYDSIQGFLQGRRYKEDKDEEKLDGNRNVSIHLDNDSKLVPVEWEPSEEEVIYNSDAYKNYVTNNRTTQAIKDQYHSMEVQLSEVVITARKKRKEDEMTKIQRATSPYSTPSNRIILDDDNRFRYRSIFDMLRTVAGVSVQGSPPNQSIIIRGVNSINASTEPLFIVDGVPVDISFINQIDPSQVLFVDVLKGPNAAIYGVRGGNGVIAVYTGNNATSVTSRKPGIIDFTLQGFRGGRQFYSPDYSKDVSKVFTPDTRTTLYWNPLIYSDGTPIDIELYTGDISGRYQVILEGMSASGDVIYSTHDINVQ